MAEIHEIEFGSFVRLQGLEKVPYLNGRVGMVVKEQDQGTQRFQVKLLEPWKDPRTGEEKDDELAFKPQNLEIRYKHQKCPGCQKTFGSSNLLKCSQCQMVRYCSKECQTSHWKLEHKKDCKLLRSVRKSTRADPEDDSKLPSDKGDRIFARQERAMRFMQKGNLAAAEKDYRAIIDVEGFRRIGAYSNLAMCFAMQHKYDVALVYAKKAVACRVVDKEDRPARKEAYTQLGTYQAQTGNVQAAKEAFQEALKMDPNNKELKMYLNRAEQQL
jgi:tetratricopeptide (TPR) repeat protein